MAKYAKVGPPFNFLGHMTETQRDSFYSWMSARMGNFAPITTFYQIRAQQLRKSAGLLEYYYANDSVDKPVPSFRKDTWQPAKGGHPLYNILSDQTPAVAVSRMKEIFKDQLQVNEEAVYWMNWLRNTIEKHEDKAQRASESHHIIATNKANLNECFTSPEYSRTLVAKKDENNWRTHPLDYVEAGGLEAASFKDMNPSTTTTPDPTESTIP